MKLVLNVPLVDMDGKGIPVVKQAINPDGSLMVNEFRQPVMEPSAEMSTVRGVVIEALLVSYTDEAMLAGEEKLKRWELATKVKNTPDPIELTVEEITLAKKLVGKAYSPMIVGQSWKVLEGGTNDDIK